MARLLVFVYGVCSYLLGVAGLLAIIAAYAGLLPFGFLELWPPGLSLLCLYNIALVSVWGILHTGMARPGFKQAITRLVPVAAERSTYVLVAGISSLLLVGLWHPLSGQAWQLVPPAAYVLWTCFGLGWAFLLASTFAINHFDLFGLRQVFYHFRNEPPPRIKFVRRAMYAYIRHPIQTGVLVGIWCVPDMSFDKLLLSTGFTVYIFVGLWFEERDLERLHPEDYTQYKREVGKLIPRIF